MGCISGSEFGIAVGVLAGPPGMVAGGVIGALVGALAGATTGGLAGAQLGDVVDQHILDNYNCLACGHSFSNTAVPPTSA